jgi:PKD repeat protein
MKPLLVKMMMFAAYLLIPAIMTGQQGVPALTHATGEITHTISKTVTDLLWDQLSDPSGEDAVISQTFTDFTEFTSMAADDFIVPAGETWQVETIMVKGGYSEGGGPTLTANLEIFANDPVINIPSAPIFQMPEVPVITEPDGGFIIDLTMFGDLPLILQSGHYWLSVHAHGAFADQGGWYWAKQKSPTIQNEFHWKNPGGGFEIPGASNWLPGSTVFPDFADLNLSFGISGTAVVEGDGFIAAGEIPFIIPCLNLTVGDDGDLPPFPADFFDPGSDPFWWDIKLTGNNSERATQPSADLIIQRLNDINLEGPFPVTATIPIEITSLNTRSIAPIEVTYNGALTEHSFIEIFYELEIASAGNMEIVKTSSEGGHFSLDLTFTPLIRHRSTASLGDLVVTVLDPITYSTIQPIGWLHSPISGGFDIDPDAMLELVSAGGSTISANPLPQRTDHFFLEMDENALATAYEGTGYNGGMWYYYPNTDWWNVWFYNHPLDTSRKKIVNANFNIEPRQADFPSEVELVFNWSTPAWPGFNQTPRPPLPEDVPTLELENQYIVRSDTIFFGSVTELTTFTVESFVIEDYNPEWLSIDLRGSNFILSGTIEHTCFKEATCPQGSAPPTDLQLMAGNWLIAEPWHRWLDPREESRIKLLASDPDGQIEQVVFYYRLDNNNWIPFYTDTDGTSTPRSGQQGVPEPELADGWSGYFSLPDLDMNVMADFAAEVFLTQGEVIWVESQESRMLDITPPSSFETNLYDFMIIEGDELLIEITPVDANIELVKVDQSWKPDTLLKGVPPTGQRAPHRLFGGSQHCSPTSAAACLKWFADSTGDNNIMGGLTADELTDLLARLMNTNWWWSRATNWFGLGTLDGDIVRGLRRYLAMRNAHYTVRMYDFSRPGNDFDWALMRGEMERGQDVLTNVSWPPNPDGTPGGGHTMTFNSIINRPLENGNFIVDFMDPDVNGGSIQYGELDPETGILTGYTNGNWTATIDNIIVICPKEPELYHDPGPGGALVPGPMPVPVSIPITEPGLHFIRLEIIDADGNKARRDIVVEKLQEVPQIDKILDSPMHYSQSIRVYGNNFGEIGPDAGVAIDGVMLHNEITFWSPEAVYFNLPDLDPGTYGLQIIRNDGMASAAKGINVVAPGEVLFLSPNAGEHVKGGPIVLRVNTPIHRSLIDSVQFYATFAGTSDRIYLGSDADGEMTKAGTYVPIGQGDGWSFTWEVDSFFDVFVHLEAEAYGSNGKKYEGATDIFFDPSPFLLDINRDNSRLIGGQGIPEDDAEVETEVDEGLMEALLRWRLRPIGDFDFLRPLEHVNQGNINVTGPNGEKLTETCGPTAAAVCLDWLNKNAGGDGYESIADSIRRIAREAGTDAAGTWDDELERVIKDMLDRDPAIGTRTVTRYVHNPDKPRDHYRQIAGNLRDSADVILLLRQKLPNGDTVGHFVTVSSHHVEQVKVPPEDPFDMNSYGYWVDKHFIDFMDPATGETVYMPVNWTNPPSLDSTYKIGGENTDGEAWIQGVIVVEGEAPQKHMQANRAPAIAWSFDLPLTGAGIYNVSIPTHTLPEGLYMLEVSGTTLSGKDIKEEVIVAVGTYQLFANYTLSDTTGTAPFTVQFTDLSLPADSIVSWHWEFGDGNESTAQHPAHTYSDPGVYDVTLTVSDGTEFISITREAIIVVTAGMDFGDAPEDPSLGFFYPTTLANNGARHIVNPNVYMGYLIDAEPDGIPTINADGDDLDNLDDEDGVEFVGNLAVGQQATVRVLASVDGYLNAWIDFNQSGGWSDAGDQIFTDQPLSAGWNTLTFAVPNNASTGMTYARFRFNTVGGLSYDGLASDGEVEDYRVPIYPQSWGFIQTNVSHLILVPISLSQIVKATNQTPFALQQDDFIGVFYNDNGTRRCGGAVVWDGQNNQTLMAFGNDQLTAEKDGFDEGESFEIGIWRWPTSQEFQVDAEFDPDFPQSDGTFVTNGLSSLSAIYEPGVTQLLPIPEGWSGISTWVEPANTDLNDMFLNIMGQLIILYNLDGIFWPAINLNSISNWDVYSGYAIKVMGDATLEVAGQEVDNKSVFLSQGWNLLPVLTSEPFGIADLFSGVGSFVLAKDVAGMGIYWPQYGINTISNVNPGNAYWVYMSAPALVDFSMGGIVFKAAEQYQMPEIAAPWGKIARTPSSHLVVFNTENSPLLAGDVIGGFTPEGTLAGAWPVSDTEAPLALTLFGNDPVGVEQSGYQTGEPLSFKVYRSATEEIFDLEVTYNPMMNTGQFESHGLSEVTAMKLSATGLSSKPAEALSIFPNPTAGVFSISGFEGEASISIFNAFGNEVKQLTSTLPAEIDLSGNPKGVYFVRIDTGERIYHEKVVVN